MKPLSYAVLCLGLVLAISAAAPSALAEECRIGRDGPFGHWVGYDCLTTDDHPLPFDIEFVTRPAPPQLPNLVPIDATIKLDATVHNWIGLQLKVKNTGSAPSGDYAWHAVVYASDGSSMWPVHTFAGTSGSLGAGKSTKPRIQVAEYTNTSFQPGLGLEVVWTVDATDYNRGGQIRELNEDDNVWVDDSGLFPVCVIDSSWDCDL